MNVSKVARLALRGGLSPLAARAELPPTSSWSQYVSEFWKTLLPMNRSEPQRTQRAQKNDEWRPWVLLCALGVLCGKSPLGSWSQYVSKIWKTPLSMNVSKVARLALRGGLSPLAARAELPPPVHGPNARFVNRGGFP